MAVCFCESAPDTDWFPSQRVRQTFFLYRTVPTDAFSVYCVGEVFPRWRSRWVPPVGWLPFTRRLAEIRYLIALRRGCHALPLPYCVWGGVYKWCCLNTYLMSRLFCLAPVVATDCYPYFTNEHLYFFGRNKMDDHAVHARTNNNDCEYQTEYQSEQHAEHHHSCSAFFFSACLSDFGSRIS